MNRHLIAAGLLGMTSAVVLGVASDALADHADFTGVQLQNVASTQCVIPPPRGTIRVRFGQCTSSSAQKVNIRTAPGGDVADKVIDAPGQSRCLDAVVLAEGATVIMNPCIADIFDPRANTQVWLLEDLPVQACATKAYRIVNRHMTSGPEEQWLCLEQVGSALEQRVCAKDPNSEAYKRQAWSIKTTPES